ncbi:MAG: DUF4367 domain-containing protein [Lachnospiraceae bacterium]|nr:DUF4367 domain-containing protein [Lachnospiraceae bacterium]
MKNEAPVMPDDMRKMVEQQVKQQIENNQIETYRRKRASWKKMAAIALVAVMAVGTTVFAGVQYYQLKMEKEGQYGLKAGVVAGEDVSTEGEDVIPEEIPTLSIKAGYLPEGMVEADDESGKYYYAATPYQGGVSMDIFAMDQEISAENLVLSDTHVTDAEHISVGDKQAIYLERTAQISGNAGSVAFNKKLYVVYPEYWQVLEIFVGADVTKEEAMKIVENLEVTATGESKPLSEYLTWSARMQQEGQGEESKLTATAEEMKQTHKVGDAFTVSADTDSEAGIIADAISVRVANVQMADDNSLLDAALADEDVQAAFDQDGKLVANEITYYKAGDGIDSLDEAVDTKTVNQKLVYATVEYTNTSDQELDNVLLFASFVGMTQDGDGYTFYDRARSNSDADYVSSSSIGGLGEMDYYDIRGNGNKNYISALQPGETVTVHFAKVVNEDELDKLYLSLDTAGGSYAFMDSALQMGYVDIRQ